MKGEIKIITESVFEMAVYDGKQIYEEDFRDEKVYVEFDAHVTEFEMEETTGYRKIRVESIDIGVAELFNTNSGRTECFRGRLQDEINEKITKNWML